MDQSDIPFPVPPRPIDRWVRAVARYLHIEATSGIVLVICTAIALIAANSPWAASYLAFWRTKVTLGLGDWQFQHSLHHVINDGLMAIFFFVIGLEVKRELAHGSLSSLKQAALPIAAALGGMIVPAGIYIALQYDQPGLRGWGIPMATDIAFVIGCLAILGPRVPHRLRILLLSLAIVDDIGAILVIAVGYTESLDTRFLWLAGAAILIVHLFSKVGVRRFPPYVVVGAVAWFGLHESGIHSTLIGVILGLMTPAKSTIVPEHFRRYLNDRTDTFSSTQWNDRNQRAEMVQEVQRLTRETVSPLEYLEMLLHPWTAYVIMPVFALANAGVIINPADLSDSIAVAVILGLVLGKPIGIVLFSWIVVRLGIAKLPHGINWPILMSGSCLAGIGFTMALFIDGLAFGEEGLDTAKIGVLVGSAISAVAGIIFLLWTLPKQSTDQESSPMAKKVATDFVDEHP